MAAHSSIPCLDNPMDREAWWATVHGVVKSMTEATEHADTVLQFNIKKMPMHGNVPSVLLLELIPER